MSSRSPLRSLVRYVAAGAGMAAGAYATHVARTWIRYGQVPLPTAEEADPLLDRLMPAYDIVERHHTYVGAPAAVTFAAACDMNLLDRPLVRAIVRARELILRAAPDVRARPKGLLAEMQSMGWVILAEHPGREVVVGAVTRPWEANVTFRSVPPDEFAPFDEPDYVKIAWTLRADEIGVADSVFRTETRAVATDAAARGKFRRYWSFVSPGIVLIRWASLGPLKREAERRAEPLGR